MKLRTTHNSIRLRLRRSEVLTLEKEHILTEKVDFPNGSSLSYTLSHEVGETEINVSFQENDIRVMLPTNMAHEWAQSQEVGIATSLSLPSGETLSLLIEKDFPCKGRVEDKADTFWELATPDEAENC